MKRKLFAVFAAVTLAVSILFATGRTPAHAYQEGEIYVNSNHSWCITALDINKPGSELVLGRCANAESQWFVVNYTFTPGIVFICNVYGQFLCITYDMLDGGQDGLYGLLGVANGGTPAKNQIFTIYQAANGGTGYYMPYRHDNQGRFVAIDNAGGNLAVNNHIDESYYCPTCNSESFAGLTG